MKEGSDWAEKNYLAATAPPIRGSVYMGLIRFADIVSGSRLYVIARMCIC
jgi:hypothetical protein